MALLLPDPFADLKETVGKSFLVAGVAPATATVGILYWFADRAHTDLLASLSLKTGAELGGIGLIVLVVAVLIYVTALGLLAYVRDAPGPNKKYTLARQKLIASGERCIAWRTLIRWAKDGYPRAKGTLLVSPMFSTLDRDRESPIDDTGVPKARLSILEWCAYRHDTVADWSAHPKPTFAGDALDQLDAYVEETRQRDAKRLQDMPAVAKRFRLGRISAALDHYPENRYGMPASMMLSRLLTIIDEKDRDRLATAKSNVECLFGFMIGSAIVAAWVLVDSVRSIWTGSAEWDAAAACLLIVSIGGCALCWVAAAPAFRVFANQAICTIDTRRQQLLEKVGLGKDLDFRSENLAFQQAAAFFAVDGQTMRRAEWNPTTVRFKFAPLEQELVADGATSVRIEMTLVHSDYSFTDREVVLRASRGVFSVSGEPVLKLKVTGTKAKERNEWVSRIQTYYLSPLQAGRVDIVATCGEVADRLALEFAFPALSGILLGVDKVEAVENPKGAQVTLRARLTSATHPLARFVGARLQFSVEPTDAARGWSALPVADDGTATSVWFVPDPAKHVRFVVRYENHVDVVEFS